MMYLNHWPLQVLSHLGKEEIAGLWNRYCVWLPIRCFVLFVCFFFVCFVLFCFLVLYFGFINKLFPNLMIKPDKEMNSQTSKKIYLLVRWIWTLDTGVWLAIYNLAAGRIRLSQILTKTLESQTYDVSKSFTLFFFFFSHTLARKRSGEEVSGLWNKYRC